MANDANQLITYVNLSDSSNYQSIYFSQLYGTFFGIYAKFNCGESKGPYDVSSFDLKAINYKGLLNIGINRAKIMKDSSSNPYLIIEVQALGGSSGYEVSSAGFSVQKGDLLEVIRTCKPIHSQRAFQDEIFDEEFYYREGVQPDLSVADQPRTVKPDDNYDSIDVNNLNIKSGFVCPKSTSIII